MKTTTSWVQKQYFKSRQDNQEIALDGNREHGFSPKAMLLSALAACSGIDVVEILTKMKVEFKDLVVDAEAEQTEEPPRVFKDIHLTYRIKTDKDNEGKVVKAIDLSLEKYCGVAAMLRKNSDISYRLKIES